MARRSCEGTTGRDTAITVPRKHSRTYGAPMLATSSLTNCCASRSLKIELNRDLRRQQYRTIAASKAIAQQRDADSKSG
jgi:hypothetical protein